MALMAGTESPSLPIRVMSEISSSKSMDLMPEARSPHPVDLLDKLPRPSLEVRSRLFDSDGLSTLIF
eukprot:CAMPEP_0171305030 /NCGR_PEP_ID=MMETSP0816-20121228/14796_1 /TAXON_ID=420281 /ORGANISM="Proboscia inermis, Strain CCAP1064/1" /LENGTH=66 /DNA_ID=CAMNT_0011785519 /DNA_START=753 /DNA_END=950 /DNA_ORIENTATION=-